MQKNSDKFEKVFNLRMLSQLFFFIAANVCLY